MKTMNSIKTTVVCGILGVLRFFFFFFFFFFFLSIKNGFPFGLKREKKLQKTSKAEIV